MVSRERTILDSSIFVAFYFGGDVFHKEAVALVSSLDQATIFVPYCVIQEVSTVLTYRFGKAKALHFLGDIEKAKNTILIEDELYPEIEAFKNIPAKISFTDTALIYLAEKYDAKLYTFDAALLKLYKAKN